MHKHKLAVKIVSFTPLTKYSTTWKILAGCDILILTQVFVEMFFNAAEYYGLDKTQVSGGSIFIFKLQRESNL